MAPQNPTLAPIAEQVLETWFGPLADPGYPNANHGLWWGKSPETDERLTEQFGGALEAAGRGELRGWCDSARGTLAYIILIDQFSRNIHRGTPGMYALDTDAVTATLSMIESGQIFDLQPRERVFAYMPLMHAENVPLQRLAVRVFARLAEESVGTPLEAELANNSNYAVDHADIVERFGRFPHRNEILGRESTAEETAFLKTPGSSF